MHGVKDKDPQASVQLRVSAEVLKTQTPDRKSRPRKFLTPKGQRNVLATAPRTRDLLKERDQTIFWPEGVTRIDALAHFNVAAVGMTGIYNWRGLTALEDFEDIAIRGNRHIIAADGNVITNKEVGGAVVRLSNFLKGRQAAIVQVLILPDGLGLDDWIRNNKFETAEELSKALKPFLNDDFKKSDIHPAPKPMPVPATPGGAPPSESRGGDVQKNPHYEILGLAGDAVAVRLSKAGRVMQQSRESLTQPGTLISLAPQAFWYELADSQQLEGATARMLGDGIIRAADELGQVDLGRITGRGASLLSDGTVAYHLGDRLLIGGKELGLNEHDGRIWLAEPRHRARGGGQHRRNEGDGVCGPILQVGV